MATFAKESLYAGNVYAATPDGRRVQVSFSPNDIKHFHRRMKEMIGAGIPIPLTWEHQAVEQMTPAELKANKPKLIAGFIEDCDLAPGGQLITMSTVDSDEDAVMVKRAKYCSPGIKRDFVDGTGRLWPGPSITHLAVTGKPTQIPQEPFELVHLSLEDVSEQLYLSLGDSPMAEKEKKPKKMADDETPETDAADDGTEEEVADEPESDAPPMPEGPKTSEDMQAILGLLKEMFGIETAPGLSDKETQKHLHTALLTAKAHMDSAEDEPGSDEYADDDDHTGGDAVEEVSNPQVLMSLETVKSENDRLKKNLLKRERATIKGRIDKAAKGLRRPELATKLTKEFDTIHLSLGDDGELSPHPFLAKLEAYEDQAGEERKRRKQRESEFFPDGGDGEDVNLSLETEEPPAAKSDDKLDPALMGKLTYGAWDESKYNQRKK